MLATNQFSGKRWKEVLMLAAAGICVGTAQPELLEAIATLLEKKKAAPEMGLSEPVPCLNRFIEAELARLERPDVVRFERSNVNAELNQLFHATLAEQP